MRLYVIGKSDELFDALLERDIDYQLVSNFFRAKELLPNRPSLVMIFLPVGWSESFPMILEFWPGFEQVGELVHLNGTTSFIIAPISISRDPNVVEFCRKFENPS